MYNALLNTHFVVQTTNVKIITVPKTINKEENTEMGCLSGIHLGWHNIIRIYIGKADEFSLV